jgi:hypothetical protein
VPPLNDLSKVPGEAGIDQLHTLSVEELHELILCCEAAFAEGEVQVNTFELFTRCQQELSRRSQN